MLFRSVLGAALRIVAVVSSHNFNLLAVNAAFGVEQVKKYLGTRVELDTQLGSWAGECS